MPSRVRPPGQHRPGGFGEGEPGTVGGRGFLVAEGQDGGQQGRERVGDGDEVPGEPVGGAVGGGGGQDAGVVGEGLMQRRLVRHVSRLCPELEIGGITHNRPTAGMRVPHAEQRVALTLHQVFVPDAGPVVRRGVEQGPAGGVAAEGVGSAGAGTGRRGSVPAPTVMSPGTPSMRTQASSGGRAQCIRGGPPGTAEPGRRSP